MLMKQSNQEVDRKRKEINLKHLWTANDAVVSISECAQNQEFIYLIKETPEKIRYLETDRSE